MERKVEKQHENVGYIKQYLTERDENLRQQQQVEVEQNAKIKAHQDEIVRQAEAAQAQKQVKPEEQDRALAHLGRQKEEKMFRVVEEERLLNELYFQEEQAK